LFLLIFADSAFKDNMGVWFWGKWY